MNDDDKVVSAIYLVLLFGIIIGLFLGIGLTYLILTT